DLAVLAALLDGSEAQELELVLPQLQLAARQDLEGGVGDFEVVAVVLLLLDVGEDGRDLRAALVEVGDDGLDLVEDEARSALVGDDEVARVAHERGIDVLEAARHFHNTIYVSASLVG